MAKMVVQHICQSAEYSRAHGAGGRVETEVFDEPDGELFCHTSRHKFPEHTQDSTNALNGNHSNLMKKHGSYK